MHAAVAMHVLQPCRTSFAIVAIRSSSIPSGNLQCTMLDLLMHERPVGILAASESKAMGFASPGMALTGLGQPLQGYHQISMA